MTFEELPNELLVQILKYVPNASSIRVVSKQFNDIMDDIERRVFTNPTKYIEELSPPVYFLLGENKYHKLIWDKAIVKGNLDLVTKLDNLGYKFNVDISMLCAAEGGHKDLVDFFIVKGANNWHGGMICAVCGGHKDLIKFFIKQGANHWNRGMACAARRRHRDLIDFFITKGANDWNWGMADAAQGEHKDLIDFFIKQGANDWNWGMACAAQRGHKYLIDFFIEQGANDWDRAMACAVQRGHKDLVYFFREKLE